ncbi:SpdD protein [Streptomyces sp. DH41]|uniref:SpdD protein n=1 Tax=Streptomyces sp. DH41 TaxID=3040125 RepID=UPI0024413A64|nr:SpdD protein [Streptomyces sp. DH41]MDG9726310.1 SpdD protein [Streptomyces sp. DH41]
MFRPKLPDVPTPITLSHHHAHSPMPSAGRTTLAPYIGPVAAVVVVGVVLTALLAAVAVTAVSVAITAVVLRSLVSSANKR